MMWDFAGNYKRADYSTFALTNNVTFNLNIGGFKSDPSWRVQDSFSQLNGSPFSTLDKDNDNDSSASCAQKFASSGW